MSCSNTPGGGGGGGGRAGEGCRSVTQCAELFWAGKAGPQRQHGASRGRAGAGGGASGACAWPWGPCGAGLDVHSWRATWARTWAACAPDLHAPVMPRPLARPPARLQSARWRCWCLRTCGGAR